MTKAELASKLKKAKGDVEYSGGMTEYAIQSILLGRSSYPVANLLEYCSGLKLMCVITDMNTDESYPAETMADVHEIIGMVMERYDITVNTIFRKSGAHYTRPLDGIGTLSINTLLAVFSVIHCKLDFIK